MHTMSQIIVENFFFYTFQFTIILSRKLRNGTEILYFIGTYQGGYTSTLVPIKHL